MHGQPDWHRPAAPRSGRRRAAPPEAPAAGSDQAPHGGAGPVRGTASVFPKPTPAGGGLYGTPRSPGAAEVRRARGLGTARGGGRANRAGRATGTAGATGTVYGGAPAPDGTPGTGRPAAASSRRRFRPRWAMAVLVCGSALAVLSGIALVGGNLAIARYTSNVQQDNLLGDAAATGQALEGPVNLLLLGVDAPIHDGQSEDTRSDTIIVLHVPATHDQAYLISVPRDTWVDVPPFEPSGWYGGQAKITEAFYHGSQNGAGWDGGAQLVALTLHQLTGLQFNGAAIVNFGGFQKIIEELGGVEFCVDTPATSEHLVLVNGKPMGVFKAAREGHYSEPVRYEVGCQHLAGWQALDYARQRKNLESGEGDYGRHRHTQQLLKAMAKQATSAGVLTSPATIDNVLRAAGDALILDTNNVPMVDFFLTLKGITANDMISLRTNQGEYHSARIEGVSAEALSPESLQMFQAAANDTMAQFLLAHPDFANTDPAG